MTRFTGDALELGDMEELLGLNDESLGFRADPDEDGWVFYDKVNEVDRFILRRTGEIDFVGTDAVGIENLIANSATINGPAEVESFSTENIPTVSGVDIVDSGSNDDGEWIRWADGTQIVTIRDFSEDEYEEEADLIDDFALIEDIDYPRSFDELYYLDGWAMHDDTTGDLDRHAPLSLKFGRFGTDEYGNTSGISRLIIYGPQGDDRWPSTNDTGEIYYSILAIGTWDVES